MAGRAGMGRLAALYVLMEQMRSVERRVAAAAVDEAACAGAIAKAVREGHVHAGRAALAMGNREEWSIAETTREVAEGRIERLAAVRAAREASLVEAVAMHQQSRLQMEQMDRLLGRARDAEAIDEGRREQTVADDRYGSRMAWSRRMRAGTE